MININNDLSKLLKKHISIFEDYEKSGRRTSQLDYLEFWVDPDSWKTANPFGIIRDNPNLESTEYPNVYQFVDDKQLLLQYFPDDGTDPIAILQWYKIKTPTVDDWKIAVYGKGLRLYYCGLLPWLPQYICKYAGRVFRADVCFDNPDKYPSGIIDLPENLTKGSEDSWVYKTFGNEKSPLFIRIYDKTLDLKDHKRFASWIYPDWYKNSCWRLECVFTGRYAKSQSAMEWLGLNECNGSVSKIKSPKKDYLKSAFYNLIMYLDFIPSRKDQYNILLGIHSLVSKKLKKLKDFISCDDFKDD